MPARRAAFAHARAPRRICTCARGRSLLRHPYALEGVQRVPLLVRAREGRQGRVAAHAAHPGTDGAPLAHLSPPGVQVPSVPREAGAAAHDARAMPRPARSFRPRVTTPADKPF
eukprot:5302415-Prymnesium_polylepis.1